MEATPTVSAYLKEVEEIEEKNWTWDEHETEAREMTWCNNSEGEREIQIISPDNSSHEVIDTKSKETKDFTCPSCGHMFEQQNQTDIHDLPGLPAGVKFDPSDQEIFEHLEAKVSVNNIPHFNKLHPLIDEFIPTIEGENGICYTHPEKLPGVNKDGQIRHFFHRPSKAYTTGTRKRRKVHTDDDGGETRWHKTGKTRPVFLNGSIKGFKKILVLYTNYGRQRKPEKTNWVMHQYHLGDNEEEREGELVISKVFYQTQPRQCGSSSAKGLNTGDNQNMRKDNISYVDQYYNHALVMYEFGGQNVRENPTQLTPNLVIQDHGDQYVQIPINTSKQ